ncbi:MAG: hypothetical protein ABGZ17_25660 [Planctomycetaceae bacterium]
MQTPQSLVIKIPAQTFLAASTIGMMTMRRLLHAISVDPASVSLWYAFGMAHQSLQGQSPLLDQPIPSSDPPSDLDVTVYIGPVHIPQIMPMTPLPMTPLPMTPLPDAATTTPATNLAPPINPHRVFDRIDAEWNSCQQIRKQLVQIRKRMSSMLITLSSLNRDLSPDERLHSDRQDKNDWMEARRWLRDVGAKGSRYIKEFDIGESSQAGKREWFEQTYEQIIVPRQRSDGLPRLEREFETYRKQLQTLMSNMNIAYASAVQDGERRAQQVLTHIKSKVRSAKQSRP